MGPGEGGVSDTPRSNPRPSNLGEGPGQGLQPSPRSVLAWGEGHFKGEGQLEKIDVTADNGHRVVGKGSRRIGYSLSWSECVQQELEASFGLVTA